MEGVQGGSDTSNAVRLETVALTKIQEADMKEEDLKMLRLSLRVTRMDKIRNEYII